MKFLPRLLLLLLALLPLAACAANDKALVEGRDYELIADAGALAPVRGKIEVVEVFGYTCPHCAHFDPQLQAWAGKQRSDVNFIALAAPFGGYWDSYARAYYAAEQLGVAKRSHGAMFRALHEQRSLPLQNVSPQELAHFYAEYGVQPQQYIDALRSEQVEQKMKEARAFAMRTRIEGTPTLVVNGKYRVKGNSFEDMLRITDALVARERAARR